MATQEPESHPDSQLQEKPARGQKDEGVATVSQPAPPTPEGLPRPKKLLLLALCMATFLAALDTTIITTALPSIAAHFDASQTVYTWVGSAYLLTYAALTPFWAKTSDIFGRRSILLLANAVFFLGSLVCAVASSASMLLAGRALQGAGGGGLVVLVNVTIGDLFSPRERGKYFGLVGMCWALAGSLGPIVGGVLSARVTWRWCFYINLPCDGLAFAAIAFFLDVHNPRTPFATGIMAIDWLGALLIAGATAMVLIGLQLGGNAYPWSSPTVILLLIFAAISFICFVFVEWKFARYPLIPLRLITRLDVVAVLAVAASHGLVFTGQTYYLPFYFQAVLGATPLQSAVWFLPMALTLSALSIPTGMLVAKTGRFIELIVTGMAIATLGTGLLIDLQPTRDWGRIVSFQLVAALGIGMNLQAPMIAVQSRVSPADSAAATACASLARNLSAAVGVVIAGVIVSDKLLAGLGEVLQQDISATALQAIADSPAASANIFDTLNSEQQSLVRKLMNSALGNVWIFFTVIIGIGFLCSLRIGHAILSDKHEEHKTGLATEEKNRNAANERGIQVEE